MQKIRHGAVGLALVSLLSLSGGAAATAGPVPQALTAAAGVPAGMSRITVHPMPIMPMSFDYAKKLSKLRGRQLEITFMAGMIPHHQAAIEMAMLAQRRAVHPAVRTLAANIAAGQRHEVQQMTGWLHAWYGLTPAQAIAGSPLRDMIKMMDKQMTRDMMMLRDLPAGRGFEKMFLQMMVPHHQMAITETQPAQDFAIHPQLLLTANTIMLGQEQEIQQLLSWLISWY